MLQDTDFFDKLPEWSSVGDVQASIKWEESPSPDERYTVSVEFRFRSKLAGWAQFVIEPIFGTDAFNVLWLDIEFTEEWRDKRLYSLWLSKWIEIAPRYNIVQFIGPPRNKTAETIYKASGFEWKPTGLTLDLLGERAQQWKAYADGRTEQPAWRHALLAEAGLLGDAESF